MTYQKLLQKKHLFAKKKKTPNKTCYIRYTLILILTKNAATFLQ